ncbi:MAG TPA: DNA repair protein RecO [Phycisphaerae bacterium]|nr:DNA repair protein RecO [Phycisphaerae bacterium]
MATTDQAICLRTTDFSETSQVLVLLTRAEGVVKLLAKGSKRPKSKSGGRIDLFSEGRCTYAPARRKDLGTLMEFAETAAHLSLRQDLDRLNAGLMMLELAWAMLAEGDPQPAAFDLLHSALARLAKPDSSPVAVLAYFQYRLIRLAGLLGQMTACAGCGATISAGGVFFSSSSGGLLCRQCGEPATEKVAVSRGALEGLAILAAAEAGQRPPFPPAQAAAAIALLTYHVEYQLGKRLRTARARPRR